MRLLFIDEEIPQDAATDEVTPYMWYYVNALRQSKVQFELVRSTDEAIRILQADPTKFDVISIDVIMPPGVCLEKHDTGNGTRTGLAVLNWIIEANLDVAVVLLTNVPPRALQSRLPNHLGAVRALKVLEKLATTPFQFIDELSQIGERK
jgi:CheY-like chemotaxis protein